MAGIKTKAGAHRALDALAKVIDKAIQARGTSVACAGYERGTKAYRRTEQLVNEIAVRLDELRLFVDSLEGE